MATAQEMQLVALQLEVAELKATIEQLQQEKQDLLGVTAAAERFRLAWHAAPWTSEGCFEAGRRLFAIVGKHFGPVMPGRRG